MCYQCVFLLQISHGVRRLYFDGTMRKGWVPEATIVSNALETVSIMSIANIRRRPSGTYKKLGKHMGGNSQTQSWLIRIFLFFRWLFLFFFSWGRKRSQREQENQANFHELFFLGTYLVSVTNANWYLILHLYIYISTPGKKEKLSSFR